MDEWVWVPFDVEKKFGGLRIDQFLARRLTAYSRHKVQKIIASSRVMKDARVVRPSAKVRAGERVLIAYPRRPEAPLAPETALPVLYEDDDLLAVNKPADLLSHPTDKVVHHTVLGVLRHFRRDLGPLHLLHRLDRETSGVLMLAKNPAAARAWSSAMQAGRVRKEYWALVRGVPSPASGTLAWPLGREGGEIKVRQWINVPSAVPAETRYETVKAFTAFAWVRASPRTGRMHQIRVHFAAFGHPLLGDPLYNGAGEVYLKMAAHQATAADRAPLGFSRVALHAASLSFPHPSSGRELRVEAPVADDMRRSISEAEGTAQ